MDNKVRPIPLVGIGGMDYFGLWAEYSIHYVLFIERCSTPKGVGGNQRAQEIFPFGRK
jgi:hypothetical protein